MWIKRVALVRRLSRDLIVLMALLTALSACTPAQPESNESAAQEQLQRAAPSRPPPKADRSPPIPPRFETFTVSDGLVSNEANVFLQDRQGFLWVGTIGVAILERYRLPPDAAHAIGRLTTCATGATAGAPPAHRIAPRRVDKKPP